MGFHLELHDKETGRRAHLGTLGEFIQAVKDDIRAHAIKSKLFSRQVDLTTLWKEISFAFDRVIQRAWDDVKQNKLG